MRLEIFPFGEDYTTDGKLDGRYRYSSPQAMIWRRVLFLSFLPFPALFSPSIAPHRSAMNTRVVKVNI
jgi:hypothetical protein